MENLATMSQQDKFLCLSVILYMLFPHPPLSYNNLSENTKALKQEFELFCCVDYVQYKLITAPVAEGSSFGCKVHSTVLWGLYLEVLYKQAFTNCGRSFWIIMLAKLDAWLYLYIYLPIRLNVAQHGFKQISTSVCLAFQCRHLPSVLWHVCSHTPHLSSLLLL